MARRSKSTQQVMASARANWAARYDRRVENQTPKFNLKNLLTSSLMRLTWRKNALAMHFFGFRRSLPSDQQLASPPTQKDQDCWFLVSPQLTTLWTSQVPLVPLFLFTRTAAALWWRPARPWTASAPIAWRSARSAVGSVAARWWFFRHRGVWAPGRPRDGSQLEPGIWRTMVIDPGKSRNIVRMQNSFWFLFGISVLVPFALYLQQFGQFGTRTVWN